MVLLWRQAAVISLL